MYSAQNSQHNNKGIWKYSPHGIRSPLNGEQFSVRALYAHMIGRPFLHGHCGRITEKMISRGNGKVMEKKSNHCIACSVHQCANNSGEGYCALEKIQVGTHEQNTTVVQCTDCESFVLGNQNCKDCHFWRHCSKCRRKKPPRRLFSCSLLTRDL